MKIIKRVAIATAAGAMAFAVPASAATLLVTSGELTGATGVSVGGSLFNVEFLDGTCASVFGTCAQSSFTFQTAASAMQAAQALLDQVFIDGPLGMFDSNPGLTRGCEGATCATYIPYDVGSSVNAQRSNNSGSTDNVSMINISVGTNTTTNNSATWARFTPSVVGAVPEPAAWAMMLLGFGAVGGAARYRRRKTNVAYG